MATTTLTETQKLDLIKRAFTYSRPEDAHIVETLNFDLPIEQLGIQSITALEMAGYIEEELDIEFDDKDLSSLNKISDLTRLIDKALHD